MIIYYVYNLFKYSGAAGQALSLAKNLPDKKIAFINVHGNRYMESLCEGRTVYTIPNSVILRMFYMLIILRRLRPSVIHFHGFFWPELVLGVGSRKKTILKTTLIGNDDFGTIATKHKIGFIKKHFLRRISINIVLSERLKEINEANIPGVRTRCIPNGVILPDKKPNLTMKENMFVFLGLICKRKKTLSAIEYFYNNYSMISGSSLRIIGPCNNSYGVDEFDEEYFDVCRKYVDTHGIADRVFFTGLLAKDEVYANLIKAKALLFFSDAEGMPNAVLEAMAYNCVPIVAEMHGVAREMIEDNEDGFIINECHYKKVTLEQLDNLIDRGAPYCSASRKFDIRQVAILYRSLYEELSPSGVRESAHA